MIVVSVNRRDEVVVAIVAAGLLLLLSKRVSLASGPSAESGSTVNASNAASRGCAWSSMCVGRVSSGFSQQQQIKEPVLDPNWINNAIASWTSRIDAAVAAGNWDLASALGQQRDAALRSVGL